MARPWRARDLADDQAAGLLHVDARALRASDLGAALLPLLRAAAADHELLALAKTCGIDPLLAFDDIMLSAGKEVVVAASLARPVDLLACLKLDPHGKETTLEGRPTIMWEDAAASMVDGLFVFGDRTGVVGALERHARRARSEAAALLDTSPGTVASIVVVPPAFVAMERVTGRIVATDAELGLALDATFLPRGPDQAGASRDASALAPFLANVRREVASASRQSAAVDAVFDRVKLASEGDAWHLRLAAAGADARQKLIADLDAIAHGLLRRERLRVIEREAQDALDPIARALVALVEARPRGPTRVLPMSAPRTPRDVPRGVVQIPASAWSHPTWKVLPTPMPILPTPMPISSRFAFEIVTSPDRMRAVVRALRVREEDGKTEVYELPVVVGHDRATVEPLVTPKPAP